MQNSSGVDAFYRWHVLKLLHVCLSSVLNLKGNITGEGGNLLGSLPLSLEASMLVIKFGQCGFLREGAIIGSLMDA
jgi:hypothetical protein